MKAIIYNFIKEQASIIYKLINSNRIEIVEWFCYPPHGTVSIGDFADVRFNLEGTAGAGEEIYEELFDAYPVFLDMQQRRYPHYENSLFDLHSEYNVQFSARYSFLRSVECDVVIFGNVPHGGHDHLLYRLAKKLEIPTLILFQIPVSPRYFLLTDTESFSERFFIKPQKSDTINTLPQLETPIYMREPTSQKKTPVTRSVKSFIKQIIDPEFYKKKAKEKAYQHALINAISTIPTDKEIIYFPLHLQPEMATAALGGIYVDQVLAIERLSRRIPENVVIVIKENPKQTSYQRPVLFFERLKRLDNVCIVPSFLNTFDLISRSIAVATVTGTVAWEAINMGKPAIVFGNAWYAQLPGVIIYDEGFDYQELKAIEIPEEDLLAAYNRLIAASWPGVVQSAYFGLQPDVEVEDNNVSVAESIAYALDVVAENKI